MAKWKIIMLVFAIAAFFLISIFMIYHDVQENTEQKKAEDQIHTNTSDVKELPIAGEEREEQELQLELTQSTIEIEIGGAFHAIDFIAIATDQYGYSVKEKVTCDQEIPTDVPGEYEVLYTLEVGPNQVITRKLHVTVQEIKKE